MKDPSHMVPDEEAPHLTEEQARHLHCVVCGNDDAYELREIDEPVTVGTNTAIVRVWAAICQFCGERVYDLPNHARLEEVRARLERGELVGYEPVGITYRVP